MAPAGSGTPMLHRFLFLLLLLPCPLSLSLVPLFSSSSRAFSFFFLFFFFLSSLFLARFHSSWRSVLCSLLISFVMPFVAWVLSGLPLAYLPPPLHPACLIPRALHAGLLSAALESLIPALVASS